MKSGPHIRLILARAVKAIEKVDKASIIKTGLNISDFSILEALLHKGPLPINVVGKKILLTSGSMSTAADRLEKKGFLRRVQDSKDSRCFNLHLTSSGRALITRAYKEHSKNLEKMVAILTPDERDHLVRLLKKVGLYAQSIEIG